MSARAYLPILLVVTAAAFAPGFENGWTSVDDDALVLDNPVQKRFGARELRDAFDPRVPRGPFGYQYTPLSDLSYALDRRLFGERPGPYHLQPLICHVAAAAALFLLVRRLGASPGAALCAGALFSLHPLQVEAVTWIAGRRTAMAGAFTLLALHAWSRGGRGASVAFALLANLSKQSAVVTGPLLLALELLFPTPPGRGKRPAAAAHAAITAGFFLLGAWIGRREGIIEPFPIPLAMRVVELPLVAIAFYAAKLVWPAALQPMYRMALPSGPLDPRVLAGGAIALAGLGLALVARRRAPLVSFGAFLAGIALAPGMHGFGTQIVADRYMYLTIAGAAIVAAAGLEALAARSRAVAVALGVGAAASLALATAVRVAEWRSDLTIFRAALASDPGNAVSRRYLGRALADAGRLEEGEAELRRAAAELTNEPIRGQWQLPRIFTEIGIVCEKRGDPVEAERAFEAAVAIARPREVDHAAAALARFRLRRGDREGARRAAREGLARADGGAHDCRRVLDMLEPGGTSP